MDNSGLKKLVELSASYKKEKYNVPGFAIPKTKYSDKTSNGLTKAVIDYLTLKGHYAVRINTQGNYSLKLKKFIRSGSTPGTPDVVGSLSDGRYIGVEIKIGRDKLSPAQIAMQQRIKNANGIYFVAKDFQSFYDFMEGMQDE